MAGHRKHCHCTYACTSVIGERRRRQHYAKLDGTNPFASSESEGEPPKYRAPDHITLLAQANICSDTESVSSSSSDQTSESEQDTPDSHTDNNSAASQSDTEDTDTDSGQKYDDYYLQMLAEANPWDNEDFAFRDYVLTKSDMNSIKAFKLLGRNLTRKTFNEFRFLFRDELDIESEWKIIRRMHDLAQVDHVWYDMCKSSCIAFTGEYAELDACPVCDSPRRDAQGNPHCRFAYIPLIPRLEGFFMSESLTKLMSYRHHYKISDDSLTDVFDGQGYKELLNRRVVVDGKTLPHKYFHQENDLAFSFFHDGHSVFRKNRSGPSATPLLLKNLNLPPEIRTRLDYLIPLCLIPGKPKDLASFAHPFQEELVRLAYGVPVFNAATRSQVVLHGYTIQNEEDMRAADKVVNNSSVNSFVPCRTCKYKACRDPSSRHNHYYCPLAHIYFDENGSQKFNLQGKPIIREWPADNLPYRSHESFKEAVEEMAQAKTQARRKEIRFNTGIRGIPLFHRVQSQHHGRSSPHDAMHEFGHNIIPNLVNLWKGNFKPLKGVSGDYEIPGHIWEQIGRETVEAIADIPAQFVRKLPNISTEQSLYNAESWLFWFMYLMPILLRDRFDNPVYYEHACALRDIMVVAFKLTITNVELAVLRSNIIHWVRAYEWYYYRYEAERLPVCTLTLHALLHVADDIFWCGPSPMTWTFYGERFCGYVQNQVKSRSAPFANLSNRMLYAAYLSQIVYRYDIGNQLAIPDALEELEGDEILSRHEKQYEGYGMSILRPPHNKNFAPSPQEYSRIVRYFKQVMGKPEGTIRQNLSITNISESWGKVRIASRGDSIRVSSTQNERNNSFVRYKCQVLVPQPRAYRGLPVYSDQTFYGRLDRIVVCHIPDKSFWKDFRGTTRLLAIITPCQTKGKDATQGVVEYTRTTVPIATDLQTISAVVGRVLTRGRFGLIDRSDASAAVVFLEA